MSLLGIQGERETGSSARNVNEINIKKIGKCNGSTSNFKYS